MIRQQTDEKGNNFCLFLFFWLFARTVAVKSRLRRLLDNLMSTTDVIVSMSVSFWLGPCLQRGSFHQARALIRLVGWNEGPKHNERHKACGAGGWSSVASRSGKSQLGWRMLELFLFFVQLIVYSQLAFIFCCATFMARKGSGMMDRMDGSSVL